MDKHTDTLVRRYSSKYIKEQILRSRLKLLCPQNGNCDGKDSNILIEMFFFPCLILPAHYIFRTTFFRVIHFQPFTSGKIVLEAIRCKSVACYLQVIISSIFTYMDPEEQNYQDTARGLYIGLNSTLLALT